MSNSNPSGKMPRRRGSLKSSEVAATPSGEVQITYSPTPPPIPEGKEIHPRRRIPLVPEGKNEADPDSSSPTVLERPTSSP